jgi:hypothetical protein
MDRRTFLKGGLLVAGGGLILPKLSVAYDPSEILAWTRYPLKSPKYPLIVQTMRPRNFETPVQYYEHFYTPNEAFYVR